MSRKAQRTHTHSCTHAARASREPGERLLHVTADTIRCVLFGAQLRSVKQAAGQEDNASWGGEQCALHRAIAPLTNRSAKHAVSRQILGHDTQLQQHITRWLCLQPEAVGGR